MRRNRRSTRPRARVVLCVQGVMLMICFSVALLSARGALPCQRSRALPLQQHGTARATDADGMAISTSAKITAALEALRENDGSVGSRTDQLASG